MKQGQIALIGASVCVLMIVLLVVALGLGADASFRAPMAIVVIGGLMTSTLLCLLAVPVAYSVVDDVMDALRRWRSSRVDPSAMTPFRRAGEQTR